MSDIKLHLEQVKTNYRQAILPDSTITNQTLIDLADILEQNINLIIEANQKDLSQMEVTNPKYDRLLLNQERIKQIADSVRHVAYMDNPLRQIIEEKMVSSGLHLQKISVPIGVIGVIYEARPNVSIDVFSLCFKTGNACILKGGTEAYHSNKILVSLIHEALIKNKISTHMVYLMPANRECVFELLNAVGIVDLCIPRGSNELIKFVRENARIPVIETGAGIVHTYYDEFGSIEIAPEIIFNAKTRRVSVCNALDCLIIHQSKLNDLRIICEKLRSKNVIIYADDDSYKVLVEHYPQELLKPASAESYGTEFLDYKISIKTVGSIDGALSHIKIYSSGHSEAIITENEEHIIQFFNEVDAAAIYSNASTAFTDGGEFGMGAEIGISTQKIHARGPMGLKELTSYKWLARGFGQTR